MFRDIQSNPRSWIPFIVLMGLLLATLIFVFFDDINAGDQNLRKTIQPSPGCVLIQGEGDPSDSIDVVFLPDNYNDLAEFQAKTDEMVDSFLKTVPYYEYKNMFNFYRIENLNLELNCDYDYGGDAIVCNPVSIKREVISCPYDYPIVIVNTEGIQKFYELLRSSSWMGTASLNAADDPLVLTHEFAHSAWDFADEYVYGGDISWDAPNCDSDWETCPKFKVVDGSECVVGCVNNFNSRSVDVGIMRDYWKSDRYGLYNEYYVSNQLEDMIKKSNSYDVQKSMPLYSVKVVYSPETDKYYVSEIVETTGFPDGTNTGYSGDSVVSILDENDDILYTAALPTNQLIYLDGHDAKGENNPGVLMPAEVEYVVNLPAVEEADTLELISGGSTSRRNINTIESTSLNSLSVEVPATYTI